MKNKSQFVYVTYISSSAEKVWNALMDPETTRKYWGHLNVSDWKPGSDWRHEDASTGAIRLVGKVVESTPPRRLVITWAFPADAQNQAKHTRVTFDVEPIGAAVRLKVTHDELEPGSEMERGITRGWPAVLSNLKSLLETGQAMEIKALFEYAHKQGY
jgi:uncharacterized protein YndB with AHSA1/START domain